MQVLGSPRYTNIDIGAEKSGTKIFFGGAMNPNDAMLLYLAKNIFAN